MLRVFLYAVFVVILFNLACTYKTDIPLEFPTPPPAPGATPLAPLELKRDAELEARIAKIAAGAKGKVGVAAVVLETGEAALLNPEDRFPMQSVYKLPIAMAVMEQVRQDKLDLDEKIGVTKEDFVRPGMRSPLRDKNPNGGEFTIRELIRLALVESDGTASDVLIRIAWDPSEQQGFPTQIGVREARVHNTGKRDRGDHGIPLSDRWKMGRTELTKDGRRFAGEAAIISPGTGTRPGGCRRATLPREWRRGRWRRPAP